MQSHALDAPSHGLTSLELSRVDATKALCDLYQVRDLDCDKRITRLDEVARCGQTTCVEQPNAPLLVARGVKLAALHQASQLATELADQLLGNTTSAVVLDLERVLADPASFLVYRIQHRYWDALTRTIEPHGDGLWQALRDEKQGQASELGLNLCAQPEARCGAHRAPDDTPMSPKSGTPDAPKTDALKPDTPYHLYVPANDPSALKIYQAAAQPGRLEVATVPRPASAQWVNELTNRGAHGLLTLAYDQALNPKPFVVPGGRFNEMYGWDSFFITWGLIEEVSDADEVFGGADVNRERRLALASAMVDHQQYEILHYGKVLNANRTYYLTRSQPPFVAPMVRMVGLAKQAPASKTSDALTKTAWVEQTLQAAVAEYEQVWSALPRRTSLCDGDVCLARYYGEGTGQPPEVEPGHFAAMYQKHAVDRGHCAADNGSPQSRQALLQCASNLERAYVEGQLVDRHLDAYFVHDRCMRESGHDTTFRWRSQGADRCADYVTVDLNALLFRYEIDIAQTFADFGDATQTALWCDRARARQRLIQRYLWDDEKGAFFDYDTVRQSRSTYLSATSLYPLWANRDNTCGVQLLSHAQATRLVRTSVERLEAAGGLMATDPASLAQVKMPTVLVKREQGVVRVPVPRQWEAPNGWAPHQMLAWQGLVQHGFHDVAQRLAYRWLHMIIANSAQYHGTVPEKFDVVARSHRVFAEYGNVNAEFSYIAREGFGWVNASVLTGLEILSREQRERLRRLEPPEVVF